MIPITADEANKIVLESETNIERLRDAAIYWRDCAQELTLKIEALRHPVTEKQIERLLGSKD